MANSGLKDDQDKRTGNPADSFYDREFNDIVQHYDEDGQEPKAEHGNSISEAEARATQRNEGTSSTGLADQERDAGASNDVLGKGYTGGITPASNKKQDARTVFKALGKKKLLVAGVAGGGLGTIVVIVLLLLFASSLGIPNLAQNITTYEFARMSRQFSESAQRTTDEALVLQADDNPTFIDDLKEQFKDNKVLQKINKYRPAKVMQNMKASGNLQLKYGKTDVLGRPVLTSIILGGEEYKVAQQGVSRFIPGLSSIIKFKNGVSFSSDFQPALTASLRSNDIGLIVRDKIAKSLRKELRITLTAWTLSRFKDKDTKAAQIEETRERATKVDQGGADKVPNNAVTDKLHDGVDAAAEAEKTALSSDTEVEAAIQNGGVLKNVQSALQSAIETSKLDTGLGIANPINGALMGMCIVYDGSLNNSGSTIDKQTAQQQATYYYVASAASQQQRGTLSSDPAQSTELAAAINATNTSLDSTAPGNAQVRASGYDVDTSNTLSAEQSAGGEFTLLNATLGQMNVPAANAVADTINAVADKVCPVVTNVYFAVGGAIVNIGVGVVSLGSASAGEEVAGEAASEIINVEAKSLAESLVTKYIGKTAGRITGLLYDTGKGTVKSGITVAAATVLAKLIVNGRSGQSFSGFAQGADLKNAADAGGNIHANELERSQLFGRPLLESEVCTSNQQDRVYLASNVAQESGYNRYLNIHNANSLVSRTAVALNASLGNSLGTSLLKISSTLLHPLSSLGTLVSLFTGVSHAAANCNSDSTNYGNVQFGWSKDEEDLINSNPSYRPVENQQILDESGQASAIAQKYSTCFGYSYNSNGDGSIDPTDANGNLVLASGPGGPGSLGTLLSSGAIVRDEHGNVQPEGLCSPKDLTYNSPDPLAADPINSTKASDLILRWRLAMQYDATLNQLTDIQNAST